MFYIQATTLVQIQLYLLFSKQDLKTIVCLFRLNSVMAELVWMKFSNHEHKIDFISLIRRHFVVEKYTIPEE